ncbi:hypothetical protein KQI61_05785 [Anaerocolumna aminovalerica]|uniref:hypothetical protein n=1 Tax=Anaerocolumna aminovalerica TaxID=1527 RepID=UPI001C0EE809|nr:hypothetical protein [Anaerocolumna aminovalerica]MBU5331700.1 hypothetical protein [Anaerocolumna aminovalerica]
MIDESLDKIVNAVTKECGENFEKHKITDYTLANLTTIPFTTINSRSRVVNSWGTDEDTDEIICYSENGWEIVNLVVQVGAGKADVISKECVQVSKEVVVKKIKESNLLSQMEFINKAYSILLLSSHKSDLF